MTAATQGVAGADPWVQRWLAGLPANACVLDFASGAGRHARLAAAAGHRVTAADRDGEAMRGLAGLGIECIQADLESGPWPLAGRQFDAVVMTNYLFRARFALLAGLLAPGGRLIAATFARGNAEFGRPRSPDFLLGPGELLARASAAGLMVLAYEHGFVRNPPRPSYSESALCDRCPANPGPVIWTEHFPRDAWRLSAGAAVRARIPFLAFSSELR